MPRRKLEVNSSCPCNTNTTHFAWDFSPGLIRKLQAKLGRGRRRSAPRRRTTPPPSPGRARGRQPKSYGSAAAVAAARARSRLQGRQAHREKERQGSAYVSVCICLWEGLWGGCECARARRPVRKKKAGQLHTAPEPPPLPSATDSTHQPTKHLSCLSCPPSPLSLVASQ